MEAASALLGSHDDDSQRDEWASGSGSRENSLRGVGKPSRGTDSFEERLGPHSAYGAVSLSTVPSMHGGTYSEAGAHLAPSTIGDKAGGRSRGSSHVEDGRAAGRSRGLSSIFERFAGAPSEDPVGVEVQHLGTPASMPAVAEAAQAPGAEAVKGGMQRKLSFSRKASRKLVRSLSWSHEDRRKVAD